MNPHARRPLRRRPGRLALVALALAACTPPGADESAIRRGDEAFARGSLEEALAEYRLAVRQGSEEPDALARVGHAYVALGRIEEATDFFAQAAARDPRWGDMGVADLVHAARDAAARNDRFRMAAAMDAARQLRPGITAPDLTLPLARHYRQVGEFARALPLYTRAFDEASGPSPELQFEIGEVYQEVGDCRSALIFFDLFVELAAPRDRGRAAFNIGSCSLRLAQQLRQAGGGLEMEEALAYVNRSIALGEPRNGQAEAWFEKGELLSAMGDCDGALDAFGQVRVHETGNTQLVSRAEDRIQAVRFGRDLVTIRGRCY